jgi:peptide/nickel transport system substrate-binding protein
MKQIWRLWLVCLLFAVGAACAEPLEEVAVTREVVVFETAPPQEGVPVVSRDLFLRATEVTRTVETLEAVVGTPTPPEPEPKELVVCQAAEPDSLFLYSTRMLDKENIHHAIYENLVTQRDYGYQAQGIEKLPSLEDGDAVLQTVTVQAGDTVLSADGEVVTLAEGVEVVNAAGEQMAFDGTPLEMSQLVVDFTLKPMVWSDGTPVSAVDSVFSFEVNRTVEVPFTTVVTYRTDRTAGYEATGDLSLRWTGLPGWLDQTYFLNVWTPLPEHQLGAYDVDMLVELPEAARRPLSSGPFVVTEWQPGESIHLAANRHYYRVEEALPFLDSIVFRYSPDPNQLLSDLLAGQCDIMTQSVAHFGLIDLILGAEENGLLQAFVQPGAVFEHLAFGIDSFGEYGDGNGRPDWFQDVRVRQALALCTDRQSLMEQTMYGQSEVWQAYASPNHPLRPADAAEWPYDVAAANTLLDEVGYLDSDGDGIREDPATGTPFAIELITSLGGELRQQMTAVIAENWLECGVQVNPVDLPSNELFAPGPEGLLFGRQFDVALFAWNGGTQPPCHNWLSSNIFGTEGAISGLNATGWSNEAFDAACQQAQQAFWGSPEYVAGHQEAWRIFAEELPSLPLFPRVKLAVARPEVLNIGVDATQNSELWNLFEIDLEQ